MNKLKKVVVFGGGTGLSCLLEGLKLFPIDVTAIIAVSDNGSSTGQLKKELDIPAVGDIGKVLISMANVDEDALKLLSYRFTKEGFLENHPIKNILLAALTDIKGNITDATKYMCDLLNVNGTILPLTEEKVELVGKTKAGKEDYIGEEEVSKNIKNIKKLTYDHNIKISKKVVDKIKEADLIIFSSGSLYTSILPHLISNKVKEALKESKAPIMYICNLVSQPGETDGYSVSDHLNVLNNYLLDRKVDIVIANNGKPDRSITSKYLKSENKTLIKIDKRNISKTGARLIEDNIFTIENGTIRHNSLKTAYIIFSYLMEDE